MTLQVIIWGLIGSISLNIHNLKRPTRKRAGWDFVVHVGFFSAACFALTEVFAVGLYYFCPESVQLVSDTWRSLLPILPLKLLFGFTFIAPFLGIISIPIHSCSKYILYFLTNIFTKSYEDTFFNYLEELLGNFILISTKSGKVYVGLLLEYTEDLNESQRYIKITPAISGYRRSEDKKVIFNVKYLMKTPELGEDTKIDMIFPTAEITSMSCFDVDLHMSFLRAGETIVEGFGDTYENDEDANNSEALDSE